MSPAPNPYIIGPPIGGESGFFGRDEIFQEIEELLLYPNKNSVILYGQRSIGKTSLLLQLESRLPKPPFFAIYFDLADKALLPVQQVLFEIAVVAASKAGMPLPAAEMFEESPDAFHEQFLPSLYQQLGRQQQPIFLLDEFKAVSKAESDLPPDAAVRALDDYLYGLLTTQSYTDFIFAAGRRMAELSQVVNSSYRADLARFVPVLNPDQAKALILQAGAPRYYDGAIDQILALTRGHPYFTQQICHALYEQAIRKSPEKPRVSVADVEAIIPVVLAQDSGVEAAIWNSIPYVERLTLAAIAGQTNQPGDRVTEGAISSALSQARIPPSLDGLGRAPENLVDWQMLAQSGAGYTFFIDYVRRWVAHHRPLETVKKGGAAVIGAPVAISSTSLMQPPQAAPDEIAPHPKEASQQQPALAQGKKSWWLAIVAALLLLLLCASGLIWGFGDQWLNPQGGTSAVPGIAGQTSPDAGTTSSGNTNESSNGDNNSTNTATGDNPGGNNNANNNGQAASGTNNGTTAGVNAASNAAETATALASVAGELTADNATATASFMATEAAAAVVNAAANRPSATPTPQGAGNGTSLTPGISGQIQIAAAPQLRPILETVAASFGNQYPEVEIAISEDTGPTSLERVQQGVSTIAFLSQALTPEETANLDSLQIVALPSQNAAAVIMHALIPANNFTTEQLQAIFTGSITNWSELGGQDAAIVVIVPPPDSAARTTFEQQIMGNASPISANAINVATDRNVRNYVASHPAAIGLSTLEAALQNPVLEQAPTGSWAEFDTEHLEIKAAAIDGITPTAENISNGIYRLAQPLNLVAQESPDAATQALLEYLLSPEGQRLFTGNSE